MITLQDAQPHLAARDIAIDRVADRTEDVASHRGKTPAIAISFLHGSLFLTILVSSFVFFEPSPYEMMAGVLVLAFIVAGIPVGKQILPLVILLLLWNVGGAFSLAPVVYDNDAVKFIAISFYLGLTAIIYACVFMQHGMTMTRLAIMRRAYIGAAIIAAAAGIAGYLHLFPGSDMFTLYDRARGPFKDPNVYGPFLVLPMLLLIQSVILRGLRLRYIFAFGFIALGLLLSFSRGAWTHFAFSAGVMVFLMFLSAPTLRLRSRIVGLSVISAFCMAGMVLFALSFNAIGTMFKERASLVQSYDVGQGGRFGNQSRSLSMLLERPNGFGPLQFDKYFPQAPHEVYINAFSAYGWLGGITYAALILLTLAIGYRTVFIRTPWQPYQIAVLATFTGVVLEGFIIDTDHWRHFFLLLGLVWGLSMAALNARQSVQHKTA